MPTNEIPLRDLSPLFDAFSASFGPLLGWYGANAKLIFALFILGAIVGEKIYQWVKRRDINVRSSFTSLVSGAGFLVAKTIFEKLIFVALAFGIYENFRLFDLSLGNPLVWIGVLFARDFIYYWVHRMEHTTRFLWASHLIHHSPRNIDMTSAVRIPWMEAMYKPWFSLWMPLIGFHPLAKIGLDVAVAIFQQLHHTKAFPARPDGSYSLFARIFVTPSTHRVHHGYNPEYIDKNFGAVFIFWDKLFGTYAPEVAEVKFGVGEADAVNTPSDAFVGGFKRLGQDMVKAGSPRQALAVAIGRP